MPWAWQLWLSPRPAQRTTTPSEPRILLANDAGQYEFLTTADGIEKIRETHYVKNEFVRKGLSGPPMHIHIFQDEYFQVERGVLGVHKDGQDLALTKNDGPVEIPAGVRHRFWMHESSKEDLVFQVWTLPQDTDRGFDEKFMRHVAGYLRDCEKAGLSPSLFQLLLFFESGSIIISPPFWVPIWLLVFVQYVLAQVIGRFILGYQENYPEYSGASYKQKGNKKSN